MGAFKNKNDKSQTFTTWALYFMMDSIMMFSTYAAEHGDVQSGFIILLGFSVGSFVMSTILLFQVRIGYSWFEAIVTLLLILCIGAWWTSGPLWAVIFGVASEAIVGLYLIYRTFKFPEIEYNLIAYLIFLLVSILTSFKINDIYATEIWYPMTETILSTIILIPLLKKWWKK